jgi:uncharacterized protein
MFYGVLTASVRAIPFGVMETYSLRHLTLRPGEALTEELAVPLDELLLGGQPYRAHPATVPATLEIQRAATGDVFRLAFATTIAGPCMRCLEPATVVVETDAREYHSSDAVDDPELTSDYVVEGELRVGNWVRDQVALALPTQILCRNACAGLCAVCGKNLNHEPHTHDDLGADPRWAALEALRADD